MADKIKIAAALLLVAAGVAGFYFLDQSPMILRVAAVLAGLVAGAVTFLTSEQGKLFYAFSQESVVETKKVVWPTRKETTVTTMMVFVMVFVASIFFLVADQIMRYGVGFLLGISS